MSFQQTAGGKLSTGEIQMPLLWLAVQAQVFKGEIYDGTLKRPVKSYSAIKHSLAL